VVEPFVHSVRVRYAECDMQGVVFNAHYLAYFDLSMTELWRAAFGGYQAMLDRGVDLVVAEAQLSFRASARFDERLDLEIWVSHLGTTSIVTDHVVRREQQELVRGFLRHVFVDRRTMVKTPIPDWARTGLQPWTATAADHRSGDSDDGDAGQAAGPRRPAQSSPGSLPGQNPVR
jgi:acyl-CoA thioester hydrolase